MIARIWKTTSGIIFLALLILGWQYVSDSKIVSPVYLPSPSKAFSALTTEVMQGDLSMRILRTLEHMTFGWLLASLLGIGIGTLIGISRQAREFLGPTLEFFRPLPASALFPVAIAIFGLSENMVYAVIAFGAVWPTLLATVGAYEQLSVRLLEVRQLLRMSTLDFIRKIALPFASPEILAGMRLSLTVALILSVTGEILSSSEGLGHWIMLQARSFRSDTLFAGVMLFGVIGYLSSKVLTLVERRVLKWKLKSR